MKKDVVTYLSRCMECQLVKVEHQHPAGLLNPLPIAERKWDIVSMDLLLASLKQNISMIL